MIVAKRPLTTRTLQGRSVKSALPLLLIPVLALGCTDTPPAQQDLPSENVTPNTDERLVYVMPDKFPNVVAFCDGSARVYATTRETQDLVVIDSHSECRG